MNTSTVYDCSLIELSQHHTRRRGNLTVVEDNVTVPFDIRRVFYLYDVPGGHGRGGHAHRRQSQLIVAASGSFSVTIDDGNVKRTFLLNHPYQGLLVMPGIWNTLEDFSSGAVCMVLASDAYDESEYIREYDEFMAMKPHPVIEEDDD